MTEAINVRIPDLITPKTDEDFFAIGRLLLPRSTCLKTQTAALIVQDGVIVSYGYNMCCPQGQLYGMPVAHCPRVDTKTGTAYALCKPIHAEVVAVLNAFGISHAERTSLWHFPGHLVKLFQYKDYFRGKATLYLLGHYWACEECVAFLKLIGITEIKFDDLSGNATLSTYARAGLTGTESGCVTSGTLLMGVVSVTLTPTASESELCARLGLTTGLCLPKETGVALLRVPAGTEFEWAKLLATDASVIEANLIYRH